ncbi:MAG: hypothetical protein ACYDA3_13200 [Gaiellaceae bacterium]
MEPRKVIVLATDSVDEVEFPFRAVDGELEVLVVAPALNTRIRRWCSDDREALQRASENLGSWVLALERIGIRARGRIGDANPLQAIADELARFPAGEVVVAKELGAAVRARFAVPVADHRLAA